MIQIFFLLNLHKVGPLIAQARCHGALFFPHLKFKFGYLGKIFAHFLRTQIQSVLRHAHSIQFENCVVASFCTARGHEVNEMTGLFEVFQKLNDL